MIGIFTANTKQQKFFARFLSRSIQLFTWCLISKEAREYFKLKSSRDCPTHSVIYVEKTQSGEWIIFEADAISKYNYEYYPMRRFAFVEDHKAFHSVPINKAIAEARKSEVYGFMQLFNHIRIWFWWQLKRDVRGKNAWFVKRDVCSEYSYLSMRQEALTVGAKYALTQLYGMNQNNVSPATLLDIIYHAIMRGEMIEE